MTLPVDILDKIQDLERRLSSLETSPQPPNISLSDTASASFTVDPVNAGNFIWFLTNTIEDDQGAKRLLAVPNQSIYKNSISDANKWPDGANWSEQDVYDLIVTTWIDWGETDNKNVVIRTTIFNQGLSSFNILYRVNHRYLLMDASVL